MAQDKLDIEGMHTLPPLILHPFTESASTVRILESARASLSMLEEGASTAEESSELERQLLDGRFTEFRMLFYVGKDVTRWLDQCVDACERSPELKDRDIPPQSFAQLLIRQTPADVAAKLRSWGVVEYARIFSRSIGIFSQFRDPPNRQGLQAGYLLHYYQFADYAYSCWADMRKYPILPKEQFPFILYASGEYTKILEEQWKDVARDT
jgi:hypothetical protein